MQLLDTEPVAKPNIEGAIEIKSMKSFDFFLVYSDARDIYSYAIAMHDSLVIDKDELVIELRSLLGKIIEKLVSMLSENLSTQSIAAIEELHRAGMGEAGARVTSVIGNMQSHARRISAGLLTRDFLTDQLLGHHLCEILWDYKLQFSEIICSARNGRKFSEEQASRIDLIMTSYMSDRELRELKITEAEFLSQVNRVVQILKILSDKYNLQDVRRFIRAFDELLNVNSKFYPFQLTEEEVLHMGSLLKDYFVMKIGGLPSNINRAIYPLGIIKAPFITALKDLQEILDGDCLLGKGGYIINQFSSANAQVYKTYEGLALTTACHEELQQALIQIKTQLAVVAINRVTVVQVARYGEYLTNYFQLSMRLSLPLGEMIEFGKKMKQRLEEANKTHTRFYKHATSMLLELCQCHDTLKLKIRSLNALQDINVFINKITRLDEPETGFQATLEKLKSGFFYPTPTYKQILTQIRDYLCKISESLRTEEHANFQGILENLKIILSTNGIVFDTLSKRGGGTKEELLIIEVFQRYKQNVLQYQNDRIDEPTICNGNGKSST